MQSENARLAEENLQLNEKAEWAGQVKAVSLSGWQHWLLQNSAEKNMLFLSFQLSNGCMLIWASVLSFFFGQI